jgi:hypothetical protein
VTKNVLSPVRPCFGWHVKPKVLAAFAGVITHQPALGPRGGLWPVLLSVIHKEGLCFSSGTLTDSVQMAQTSFVYGVWQLRGVKTFTTKTHESLSPCRPSTSLQRLIRLDRVNRRDRFSMKKSLRSSASFHTKHASNVNAIET